MKISIIIVTYQSLMTLKRAIESVLVQTYKNFELIIIDGNSKDGTQEYLKKLTDKRIHWLSEPDTGIYNAMNKGIDMATGVYIQFMGADDFLLSQNVLSNIYEKLSRYKNIDILSSCIYMYEERLGLVKYGSNRVVYDKKKYDGSMIPHPGLYVSTNILKKNRFDETYKSAADYDLFLRLYYEGSYQWMVIPDITVVFSLGGISSVDCIGLDEHLKIMKEHNLPQWMIRKAEIYRMNKLGINIRGKLKNKVFKNTYFHYLWLRVHGWRRWDRIKV